MKNMNRRQAGINAAAWFYAQPGFHARPEPEPSVRFDYDRQAWVKDGKYERCSHPETMDCRCYGKDHAGEQAPEPGSPCYQ